MEILEYIEQYVDASIAKHNLLNVINNSIHYQVSEEAINEYKRQLTVISVELLTALEGFLDIINDMNIVEMHKVVDALVSKVVKAREEIKLIRQSKYSLKKNRSAFYSVNGVKKCVDSVYDYAQSSFDLEIIELEKRILLLNTMITDINNRILTKGSNLRNR